MLEQHGKPVEISTRMRPGEWTPESLEKLVASYQLKVREMGADDSEIRTQIETPDDGSASVRVEWLHQGSESYAAMNQHEVAQATNSRGDGETLPVGEVTPDSKGLGAVFGDAERSAIDGPPTQRAREAMAEDQVPDLIITTDEDGNTLVQDPVKDHGDHH